MNIKQRVSAWLSVCGLSLLSCAAWAQTTSPSTTVPAQKLATQYQGLAGSTANADALVAGLRDGKPVTLTSGSTTPSTTFTPATTKLGYGEVNIALSLAQASLVKLGITNPTASQLAAALNGGTVVTATGNVTLAGVLAQRQAGKGWGQIAKTTGVKLGAVMKASKTPQASAAHADKPGKKPEADKKEPPGKSGGNGSDNKGGGNK